MNNQVYSEMRAKLRAVGCINWREVMVAVETLEVSGSVKLVGKLGKRRNKNNLANEFFIYVQRLGDTTYSLNGERFGPKTVTEQFLNAVDGIE